MTMKDKDVGVAVALVLQGYQRANGGDVRTDRLALTGAIMAARQELDDWAENLMPEPSASFDPMAIEPRLLGVEVTIGQASVPRTPYNLTSAALVLLAEAIDLNGPEAIQQLRDRIAETYPPEADLPAGELNDAEPDRMTMIGRLAGMTLNAETLRACSTTTLSDLSCAPHTA